MLKGVTWLAAMGYCSASLVFRVLGIPKGSVHLEYFILEDMLVGWITHLQHVFLGTVVANLNPTAQVWKFLGVEVGVLIYFKYSSCKGSASGPSVAMRILISYVIRKVVVVYLQKAYKQLNRTKTPSNDTAWNVCCHQMHQKNHIDVKRRQINTNKG